MLKASVDVRDLQRALEQLGKRDARAAINRSISRAATSLKKDASQQVREEYDVKASAVKMRVLATRSSGDKLESDVVIDARALPLSAFGRPRETAAGVRVTIRKSGGRKLYKRAFIARARSTEEVYWRVKGDGPTGLVPRGPLKVLFGPSIAAIVGTRERVNRLLETARRRIVETMRQELKYRLANPPGSRGRRNRTGGL